MTPEVNAATASPGPPIEEPHPNVTNPVPTASPEDSSSRPAVRRSRRGRHLILAVTAVVTIAFATSACTPEVIAKDAIQENWGRLAPCAERIVDRESNFQADAVNRRSGTTGLFQLHPTHAKWIKKTFGYSFSEMKDPFKNAEVAKALSEEAYRAYGDGWQPWRFGGASKNGCPA